jgi:UDP-3-O-[3-hydroxymyristoyl] glucosamine N-acyltransferase
MYALDDWFPGDLLASNAAFFTLGHCDSAIPHTLVFADTLYHLRSAERNPNVSALITSLELARSVGAGKGMVVVDNPRTEFYRLHERLIGLPDYSCHVEPYIAASARIHPTAVVSARCSIGEEVVIGPRVVVADDCIIEDGVFIDAGAVIGVEGILYYREAGRIHPVSHAGGVRIGAGAKVLAQAVVARAIHPPDMTRVGQRSIIGIASCVGHEAMVGADVVIQGNCVLARRSSVENGALVSSNSVIREYTRVGAGASVKAGSIVISSVSPGGEVSGNFARDHARHLRQSLAK